MMKAIITGATGSIGTALVKKLIENNYELWVIMNPKSKRKDVIFKHENIHIFESDLFDLENIQNLIKDNIDCFFHLGWISSFGENRYSYSLQISNLLHYERAIKLAKRLSCKVFIGCGSQAEYGINLDIKDENTMIEPINAYGVAKVAACNLTRAMCREYGMRWIWPRIFSVYGPYENKTSLTMSLIGGLLGGNNVNVTKGEQIWDYIFSYDAAKALMLLGECEKANGIYCVANGEHNPLKFYMDKIASYIAPNGRINYGSVPYSKNSVMNISADISRLKRDTQFEPEYSFDCGIQIMIEWYKEYYQ